jgi:hypothetical protein
VVGWMSRQCQLTPSYNLDTLRKYSICRIVLPF